MNRILFLLYAVVFLSGCTSHKIFNRDGQGRNMISLEKQDLWTSYIKANPEGRENKIFNRVVADFFSDSLKSKTLKRAVNFGSGCGKEDIFLLKQGWEVLSIDLSPYSGELIAQKSKGFKGKSIFFHGDFFDAKLVGKYDLVMSFYSLPFANKNNLGELMKKISFHMKKGGILTLNFFGMNHDFVKNKRTYGLTQYELFLTLLSNNFNILFFENKTFKKAMFNKDTKNWSGEKINWEVLEVIAMKN